jgi:Bacterial PH domain
MTRAQRRPSVGEHEHEPQRGLPQALPPGENLLWQGAPDWRVLARRGFHLRKLALYFGALIAWRMASAVADGAGAAGALAATLWPLPLAALALGIVALLAWLVARTTIYTLTDQRLVMRVGVVLTVTFNLPLRRIDAAQVLAHGDGSGDIALLLNPEDRIGMMHLWPHARPWHFARTQPMLRALPQVAPVAALLSNALAQSLQAGQRNAPAPIAAAAPQGPRHAPASPQSLPNAA